MDFWVWLVIIFIAWALEALAGAAKRNKERRRLPQQRVPPPAPRQQARASVPKPEPSRAPRFPREPERPRAPGPPTPARPRGPEPLVFEVPVERPPRRRAVEPAESVEGVTAEAESLESLEPQHQRALGKYGPGAEGVPPPARPRRFVLRPATVREAIVWSEILGRPKSER